MIAPSIAHPITRRAAIMHARFGHACAEVLIRLIKNDYIPVNSEWERDELIKEILELKKYLCPACLKGKQHRRAISHRHISEANQILSCIMGDICGPIWVTKAGGTKRLLSRPKYALVLVDYYSRHVTAYILDHKDEAVDSIKEYIEYMERQTNRKVKTFHSDGGGEFINNDLELWFAGRGIRQSATQVDSPFENGVVERMNRSLFESTRCLLAHAGLPASFWIDAYIYAVFLRNRMIWSTAIENQSSHETMWEEKPSIYDLPIFGCDAHKLISEKERSKLDSKSMLCIYLGVDQLRSHTYKLYNALTKKYYACADVKCDRESFTAPVAGESRSVMQFTPREKEDCLFDFFIGDGTDRMVVTDLQPNKIDDSFNEQKYNDLNQQSINDETDTNFEIEQQQEVDDEITTEMPLQSVSESYVGPKTRSITGTPAKVPFSFDSRDVYTGKNELPIDRMLRLIESDVPIAALAMTKEIEEMIEDMDDDPVDVEEAKRSPEWPDWLLALIEELESHDHNGILIYMPRSAAGGQKVIPVKFVLKRKRGPKGEVLRYKARLVAKGFYQQYGTDYTDTHAPTLRIKSLRILLVLVVTFNLKLKQFDFDTAFLNAKVEEDIYIEQPEGTDYRDENGDRMICKLQKSLYGIKQAPHNWNKEIDAFMKTLGFTPLLVDACVYHKRTKTDHFILVTLFVDDLLAAYAERDEKEWLEYKNVIASKYKIKDLGDCHWILNMKLDYYVNGNERTIYLSQEQHIRNLLKRTGMSNAHPTSVPMQPNPPTIKDCPGEKLDATMPNINREWYQSVIGGLLFIATITRIDITFAVNYLSRFSCNPGPAHVIAVRTLLRYLLKTATLGLKYTNKAVEQQSIVQVTAYGDVILQVILQNDSLLLVG